MDHIPIEFDYKDKHYKGFLTKVSGAGSNATWFLMIDNYYRGQLHFLNNRFVFYSQTGEMEELAEMFGEVVMLWYQ